MTLDENKAVVRRFGEEVLNQKRLASIDELCQRNYIELDPAPGQEQGAEGLKKWFAKVFTAFPDMNWTIEEQVAEGEHVITRWTWRGTHRAELFGIPPTNRPVKVSAWTSDHIVNGKIVDSRFAMDMLSMMQQMGVIPQPG